MESYQTVYRGGMGEIIEKKSRFIAEVFPVSNEEEAFAHLEEIRKKHWDARHHCWAYVIGRNPAAERMSDDGDCCFYTKLEFIIQKFVFYSCFSFVKPKKQKYNSNGYSCKYGRLCGNIKKK